MTKYRRINLMLPTYKRSETQLPRFIESALEQAHSADNLCFTFVVNRNDRATKRVIREMLEGKADYCMIEENLDKPHLAKFFNLAYEHTDFKGDDTLVSMLGDDMVFETMNWDYLLLKHVNYHAGLGIFYGDDHWAWRGKLCVNLFATRTFVEMQSPMPFMCEYYPRDQIDIVWQKVAEQLGMAHYIESLKIRHNHATSGSQYMDSVWRRLEAQDDVVQENIDRMDNYVAECVKNILKVLYAHMYSGIGVIMTTRDRVGLLQETVASFSAASIRPTTVHVFDDASDDFALVEQVVSKVRCEVVMHRREEPLGCDCSTPAALEWMFKNTDSEAVVILDSDTQYDRAWWVRLNEFYHHLHTDDDFGSIVMLNLPDNPPGEATERMAGLIVKPHWGACGALVTKQFWKNYILPHKEKDYFMWDNLSSRAATEDGKKNYCTSPSLIQHTGVYTGVHTGGKACCALDFQKTTWLYSKESVNPSVDSKSALFAVLARNGDIVMCSMVANMLIEQDYHVTWLTIPHYARLVSFACPRATLAIQKQGLLFEDVDWHDMSTQGIRSEVGELYRYYINAQPGCYENHATLLSSGLHMARFVKNRVEMIIGETLPDNFIDFIQTVESPEEYCFLGDDPEKPLALIAPEVHSIDSVLNEQRVEEIREELSPNFNVRIIVSKRPDGITASEVRRNYIYGLKSFLDCIHVVMNARMFVGNDSGLAWAAMYNRKCKKRIYHSLDRILQTNVWYGQIDPLAEDVIVEN